MVGFQSTQGIGYMQYVGEFRYNGERMTIFTAGGKNLVFKKGADGTGSLHVLRDNQVSKTPMATGVKSLWHKPN